jgi:hypothetical protein
MRTVCAGFLCTIYLVSLAGCNSDTPASPTPVTPPVVVSPLPAADRIIQISVMGGQWIVVGGGPLQMSARIVTATSPIEFVDDTEHVAWSVDPSGILAVDRKGTVTALASGQARVIAAVGDRTGATLVRAVPDFSGTWAGNYIITGCSGASDPRTCGRIMFNQSTGLRNLTPFTLALAQQQDQVSGTLIESNRAAMPVSGFVRLGGSLVLEATIPQDGLDPLRLTNWSSTIGAAPAQMTGSFTQFQPYRSFGGFLGTMRTEHEFSSVTRSQ